MLLVGLVLFLIFLGLVSSGLSSKQIPGRIINFLIWLVVAFVGSAGASVGRALFQGHLLAGPITENTLTMLQVSVFGTAAVIACLGLTVVVKYLGLFNLARDEIRKRAGRVTA